MAGRRAKLVPDAQLALLRAQTNRTRYPVRNWLIVMLNFKAGMRAMEIAKVRRYMALNADGSLATHIILENNICKKGSGRQVPMAEGTELRKAMQMYMDLVPGQPTDPLILSERAEEDAWTRDHDTPRPMDPSSIRLIFWKIYRRAGLIGCSSHSGRRTFITKAARTVTSVGGSLRDVQYLAGHKSLATTEGYIEVNEEVHDRLSKLI
jgi:integrase/recombinase XerD